MKQPGLAALLSVLTLALALAAPAAAAEPRTFVCDVLTAAELTEAGDLAPSPYTRLLADGGKIRFDEKSGRFVRDIASGELPARRFVVVQRGGAAQDLVARLIGGGGAAAGYDLFRIRLGVPGMPFLYLEGAAVVTGICAEG
jgi:hypothetical protein